MPSFFNNQKSMCCLARSALCTSPIFYLFLTQTCQEKISASSRCNRLPFCCLRLTPQVIAHQITKTVFLNSATCWVEILLPTGMSLSKIIYGTIQPLFIQICMIYAKSTFIDSCLFCSLEIDMSLNWTELL